MKPRWFQNGFKFFVLKPPLIGGGFTRFWRFFFFLGKVSGPKNDPILAKIHHMLGFKYSFTKCSKNETHYRPRAKKNPRFQGYYMT